MMPPLVGLRRWTAVPRQIVRSFNGRSNLPVHELVKSKVETPHARTRPLPSASGTVQFSAWRLAHAVKKADCLRLPTAAALWAGASGFLLENSNLF